MKKILLSILLLTSYINAGLPENAYKEEAKQAYTKACDGGVMEECNNLGFMYDMGDGVKQDKQKAKELFSKACDAGLNNGCENYRILNE